MILTMTLPPWGAFGFGLVLGWFLYLINRYRKGDVQLGDITTVVGALGGASVTALFPNGGELFGASAAMPPAPRPAGAPAADPAHPAAPAGAR